ncbi:MAG: hypothetical protein ACKO96_10205, partial [Flammeovirgaceae bacterium]
KLIPNPQCETAQLMGKTCGINAVVVVLKINQFTKIVRRVFIQGVFFKFRFVKNVSVLTFVRKLICL